jgi:hypothetical protein
MFGCCGADTKDWCKDFTCKVEETDKGLTITVTSDDPKKVEALKTLRKSYRELCGDNCCCC